MNGAVMAKAATDPEAYAWVEPDAWPELDLHWLYGEPGRRHRFRRVRFSRRRPQTGSR